MTMGTHQKSAKIAEGKTKIIWAVKDNPDLIIIENKKDITAFDDPKFTKQFDLKAQYATTTTCTVFELLKKASIPVAYERKLSPTEFLAPRCEMIPLEVVARRYAVGSYLRRQPNFIKPTGEPPFRFENLVVEFFLKTTKGRLIGKKGKILIEGLNPQQGEEDPLIANPYENEWRLRHSKKPLSDPSGDLKKSVTANEVVSGIKTTKQMAEILRRTFSQLEESWWKVHTFRLIDMKVEFGVTHDGELKIADVIDNDSWRLKDTNWNELSKEAFRQGEDLSEVERKYGLVASLVEKL